MIYSKKIKTRVHKKIETGKSEIDSDPKSECVEIDELIQKEIESEKSSFTEDEQIRVKIEQPEPLKMKPEMTSEYFETYDLTQDKVKPESGETQATLDVTNTTYVCSFSSCTFMTSVFNDKILTKHYSTFHPNVSPEEQKKFIKLS